MRETYPCTHPNCDQVFSKVYELKKHKATHDAPNSVFHCPECDFITLQKKNLGVHFKTHTGEKDLECPHVISFGTREQRCDYRTHDPAALSKHRKKLHGYIPSPNRSRPKTTPAVPRKTRQKKDQKVPRRRKRSQPVVPAPRRKQTHAPRKANNPKCGPGNVSASINPAPFLPLENLDKGEMGYGDSGYDSSLATLVGTDDEMGLDTLFDPSLRPQWMAKYEMSYSPFDMTGMNHELETLLDDSPFDAASLDAQTGQEGCLCQEWMIEAGIEGWDQSVLETREYHVLDA